MQKKAVESTEWKFILSLLLFAVVWLLIVAPYLSNLDFNPILRYILINLGILALIMVVFGALPILVSGNKDCLIKRSAIKGAATFLLFAFGIDLILPPYAISGAGDFVINDPNTLVSGTPDYLWHYILTTFLPWLKTEVVFGFSLLFIVAYIIVPVSTWVFAAWVLSEGQFRKISKKSGMQ